MRHFDQRYLEEQKEVVVVGRSLLGTILSVRPPTFTRWHYQFPSPPLLFGQANFSTVKNIRRL